MTPIDLSKTPIDQKGVVLTAATTKMLDDVVVHVRYGDLQELIRRAECRNGKVYRPATVADIDAALRRHLTSRVDATLVPKAAQRALYKKGIAAGLPALRDRWEEIVREAASVTPPQPVTVPCLICQKPTPKPPEDMLPLCSAECAKMHEANRSRAVEQVDESASPAERITEMVAGFTKDRRLSLGVRDCIRFVQNRADGMDDSAIKRNLQIDASELAGLRASLDKYATTLRLTEEADHRKLLIDLLKEELPKHGVPE